MSDFVLSGRSKARRVWRCACCGCAIKPGEHYEWTKSFRDGRVLLMRDCVPCHEFWVRLVRDVDGIMGPDDSYEIDDLLDVWWRCGINETGWPNGLMDFVRRCRAAGTGREKRLTVKQRVERARARKPQINADGRA